MYNGEEGIHKERSHVFNRVYIGITLYKSKLDEQGTQTREILLRGSKKVQEKRDEQNVCRNPEIQNSEERSNEDKLQEPSGNTFLKYGVLELTHFLLSAAYVERYEGCTGSVHRRLMNQGLFR